MRIDPLMGWLLALGSAVAMFLALYRVIPNTPLALGEVWPGALLAGVLFVLLSQASGVGLLAGYQSVTPLTGCT